jgi:hypothetical protein
MHNKASYQRLKHISFQQFRKASVWVHCRNWLALAVPIQVLAVYDNIIQIIQSILFDIYFWLPGSRKE